MADIVSVTAPLSVRLPNGEKRALAHLFPHPQGLVYFDLYWHQRSVEQGVHVVEGKMRGEGPWRVGEHIFYVLGCAGSDPQCSLEWQQWQFYLQTAGDAYPPAGMIASIARRLGANID